MNIIMRITQFFTGPSFTMPEESGKALDAACAMAAERHPAQPKRLVIVKASARHTHYARVAA